MYWTKVCNWCKLLSCYENSSAIDFVQFEVDWNVLKFYYYFFIICVVSCNIVFTKFKKDSEAWKIVSIITFIKEYHLTLSSLCLIQKVILEQDTTNENLKWKKYWPHFGQCLDSTRIIFINCWYLKTNSYCAIGSLEWCIGKENTFSG